MKEVKKDSNVESVKSSNPTFAERMLNLAMTRHDGSPWAIGINYFVRTVTHHFTGCLVNVTEHELVFVNAAWVADDGRFTQAIADGTLNEVEPYPDGLPVIIGRGSLIDAVPINWELPRKQK